MQLDDVFKRVINSLPMMFAYVDNERRYRFINKSYARFFGVDLADITGKTIREVVGENSYRKISKLHDYVLAGNEQRFTDHVELKDGRRVQLDVTYIPNYDEKTHDIEGFFAVINDVSEYVSAAEILRAVHDVVHNQRQLVSTERINQLLQLGCHYLNCELGIVSHVKGNDYIVKYSYSVADPIPAETVFKLGDTYCSVTLAANEVISTESASESNYFRGHPCFEKFQLETYFGLPLHLEGHVWGTLNFSSTRARTVPFTELDIELMSLLCSAIETILTNRTKTMQLERLAYNDFLTGLTNRLFLSERFDEVHAQTKLPERYTCFLIVDIDHFKRVNDTRGHDVGDDVLQAVAGMLSAQIRVSDLCSRIGGEEFAIMLPSVTKEKAQAIAEGIRNAAELLCIMPRNKDQATLAITVSIGGTFMRATDTLTLSEVYKQADQALYAAKRNGRNQVRWA